MSPPPRSTAAASTVRDLNKAISAGKLDPVYLLHGEEEHLKAAKVQKLTESVLTAAERNFNLDTRHAADITAETLDSLLNTPPLLANRRVVVIKDVSSLKKAARQMLEKYLRNPAPDILLLLLESGVLAKTEKVLPPLCTVVEFEPLKESDAIIWVEHHVSNDLKSSIEPDAIKLLISAVGESTGELASELDKLASYTNGATITVASVEELVGVRHGETLPDLLDAIALRDAGRALELLDHVLGQPRTTGVSVLLAISTQTMGLAYARALLDSGEHTSTLHKALFAFLGAGKGVTARPWGEAVGAWSRAVHKWTTTELNAACESLLNADIRLKDTRSSSDEQILTSLILELCTPRSAPRALAGATSQR